MLPLAIGLIFLIVLLILLAKKIRIAYPILLVLAGLGLCFIPGMPVFRIDPDLIFFIFLPPLLFEASWAISLKELKKWWRIIGSFAFLVVFFTATSVAICANYFIPGFTIALGFLLGGIVSPPDAVSAGAILKYVKVPKSTSSILEGESLLNDASSLIIVRFALIAIGTGQFIWTEAIGSFFWMVIGGAGIGLILGWLFTRVNKILPTDAPSDMVLSIIYPYILYWIAEQVHSSGVLAVVFCGLYMSSQRFRYMKASSRIAAHNVWESFVYVLNGLVFMMIGLDMPEIVAGIRKEGIPISTAIYYGVMVTGTLVLVRVISSYVALISTLIFRRQVMGSTLSKNFWRMPLILGWTGMRGVVSLAAALAIPPVVQSTGEPFPYRYLILFITFVVILLTLIVQGFTLPFFISKFGTLEPRNPPSNNDKHEIKKDLSTYCVNTVRTKYSKEMEENAILRRTIENWEEKLATPDAQKLSDKHKAAYLDFLELQRKYLLKRNEDQSINEDLIREQLYMIDLEEERILHA